MHWMGTEGAFSTSGILLPVLHARHCNAAPELQRHLAWIKHALDQLPGLRTLDIDVYPTDCGLGHAWDENKRFPCEASMLPALDELMADKRISNLQLFASRSRGVFDTDEPDATQTLCMTWTRQPGLIVQAEPLRPVEDNTVENTRATLEDGPESV